MIPADVSREAQPDARWRSTGRYLYSIDVPDEGHARAAPIEETLS